MSSSGALFGNAGGRSQSKNLVEFRAGKMTMKGRMVTPDKRKGFLYVYQSDDSLMHFCWRERTKNTPEDDLLIFPDDVEYKRVLQCTTGRVYLLKFKSNNRKMFFWMQEPKTDKDDEYARKLNDVLNNPPAPGSSRSAGGLPAELAGDNDLQSILGSMNQQQLMHLLSGMGGVSSLSSLMGGRSSSALSESSPPSRIQSSPGTRSGTALDAAQLISQMAPRPTTAATLSTQPAAVTTAAGIQPATGTSAVDPVPTAATTAGGTAGEVPQGAPVTPRIQLSDLQNILSGFEAMETDEPKEIDLSAALTYQAMVPILADPEVQQRLIPLLPEAAELPKTEEELKATMNSPQFRQAIQSFSAALSSGQLGVLMHHFGLDDNASTAAAQGDVLAFAKAMQDALDKRNRPTEEDKPAAD